MRLAYVDLCGFRGYRQAVRLDFAEAFTIIDGRNGVGKSTIFDAVEFVLTGTLSKYDGAKASGETVADYLWWTGTGVQPTDRYVEVGFVDSEGPITLRRSQFEDPDPVTFARVTAKLSDTTLAPASPLKQLCLSSIIRDEHIAELSLDLKEADRYALLRDALGANDADLWIARASKLVALAKNRTTAAQQEVTAINADVGVAARRIDEARSALVADEVVAATVERLRAFAGQSQVSPDNLAGPARTRLAEVTKELEVVQSLLTRWGAASDSRARLPELQQVLDEALAAALAADKALLDHVSPTASSAPASALAAKARELVALITSGRKLGLQNDACPLCATKQSHDQFEHGIRLVQAFATDLDAEAARQAEREAAREAAVRRCNQAQANVVDAQTALAAAASFVELFERDLVSLAFEVNTPRERLLERAEALRQSLETVQRDLRILGTLRLNVELERSQRAEVDTRNRLARAQERFGRARKAETSAQALYNAARRAAAENLDRRLDRVLPLMAELYRRLRPHPIWRDIEYSVRGDVRRFLKLQVGEGLNPQFLFSSGQRRATGLAFLLSVNVSLAWSKWRSILLDDPVQHVDDFRTVHLAEVLAQFVAEGRQIICAVEDPALADLLCRRLPIRRQGDAKRVTLGPGGDGSSAKLEETDLMPLARRAIVVAPQLSAAG